MTSSSILSSCHRLPLNTIPTSTMKSMVSVLFVKAIFCSQAIVCCAMAFIVCPSLSSSPSSSGGVVISTTSSTTVTVASSRHAAQQYSTTTSSLIKLNYSVGGGNNNSSNNTDNESKSNKKAASSAFADNIGLSGIESLSTIIPSTKKEIVSPFDATASKKEKKNEEYGIPAFLQSAFEDDGDREEVQQQQLDLTIENVDEVLDEIRPYLISDGGNVNVKRLDEETGDIYLQLEGACGSCSSSKVTMKMGIERTLKFKFSGQLGKVIEVVDDDSDSDSDSNPGNKEEGGATKQLITIEQQVENEIRRISNAVIAMGGAIKILNVDSTTNEVTILYRGPQKVRKGIELALLDNVQMNVKHVKFVEDDQNQSINK